MTVDGTDVTSACTPVTDDGSLVKWEITALNPRQSGDLPGQPAPDGYPDRQRQSHGTGGTGEKAETYYFLTNGPVYVWDYHLTNYDAAGQVRVKPGKTTFSPDQPGRGCHCIPLSRCDSEKGDSAGNIYNVSGAVELMFNYANGTEAGKSLGGTGSPTWPGGRG